VARKRIIPRNVLTLFGLSFILLCVVVSLLGYAILPDASTASNQMHSNQGLKKPGYTAYFTPAEEKGSNGFWIYSGKETQEQTFLWDHADTAHIYLKKHAASLGLTPDEILNNPNSYTDKKTFRLGTDVFGRDMFSRLLLGTRVSLSVGLISVFISLVVGISLGLLAGYYRGRVDDVVMWLVNVVWSLPTLLLVVAITFALGKGFWQIFVAVGLTMWVDLARIVRGQVFTIRELEYVQAAKILGFSDVRIMLRHILPNITGPILVIAAANFASAILLEAGLSFLGLGVQPPFPSWGQMLNENYGYIATGNAYLALAPGLAIMLLVMSFNFLGNGLRDGLDVKL
jgi:oligopeptide transport system permease protein